MRGRSRLRPARRELGSQVKSSQVERGAQDFGGIQREMAVERPQSASPLIRVIRRFRDNNYHLIESPLILHYDMLLLMVVDGGMRVEWNGRAGLHGYYVQFDKCMIHP